MIYFFFYNYLFNRELINEISPFYTIEDGLVLIKNFNKENNILVISENSNENKNKLKGKFLSFPVSTLSNIIKKLSTMKEVKYSNRELYKLKTINVYFEDFDYNNELDSKSYKEAYIIY
jgi:hypothetical protein